MTSIIPRTTTVTQATFATFLKSKGVSLLRVDDFSSRFSSKLAQYFEAEHPGQLAFGSLSTNEVQVAYWWKQHFAPVLPAAAKGNHVAPGYYLFEHDKVVAWHTGKAPAKKKTTTGSPGWDIVADLVPTLVATAFGVVLGEEEDHNAMVEALAPHIGKLLSRSPRK